MSSPTPGEEIELLERVLLRLGSADTDEKLEATVCKFLTPVLLKTTSPHEAVRNKVIEVLTHVNKRLKSRSQIQLPVEHLLEQYGASTSAFLQNFSIIYITMGFPRLTIEKQTELAPKLLRGVEGKPENHQDKLLLLVLPLLGELKVPDDPQKREDLLKLGNSPSTKKQLLALLLDVLLFPYGVTQDAELPAGLSPYSFRRLAACNWKAEELEQLKIGIVRFVCSGIFPESEIFILLVLASADTRFSVATPAIAELSKICTTLDFSDPSITAPLYLLFCGNGSKVPDRKTTACSVRVRQKLLQYFIKCRGKSINTVRGIQVIFEGLFGENTNAKCKILSLQFCENLIKDGPKDLVDKVAKVILTGLSKLVSRETEEPVDVQRAAFSAIAQLARTCPQVVNQDLKLLVSYFNSLSSAPPALHDSIREALIAVAPAFAWNYNAMETDDGEKFVLSSQLNLLLAMLADNAESKYQVVQNVTSVFLTKCFPSHFAPARYLLLLIAGEKSSLYENITSYLYGVSKKDNVNYNLLSSIDHQENESVHDTNQLASEHRPVVLPSFKDMINYTFEMWEKRCNNLSRRYETGKNIVAFNNNTFAEILSYLRLCLWFSTGAKTYPGDIKHVDALKAYVLKHYSDDENNEIKKYLLLIKNSLEAKRDETNVSCLYDLLNVVPDVLAKNQIYLLEPLSNSMKDLSETNRSLIAQVYGVILSYGLDDKDFSYQINEILTSLPQKSLEARHGWILALGQAISRRIKILKEKNEKFAFDKYDDLLKFMELVVRNLSEQQFLLACAAMKSLSLVGKIIELPDYQIDETKSQDEQNKMETDTKSVKTFIFETVFHLLKSASVRQRVREEAAACLGHLAIGDGKFFVSKNLKSFLTLIKQAKDAALNIAIAQAIVCTIVAYDVNSGNVPENHRNPHCDDKLFEQFLSSLLKCVGDPNPHSRQAIAVWLMGIVKHCSSYQIIVQKKQLLQYAFTELLSDESEFVQDVSSRGLGLVFNLSDSTSQKDLANSLVEQLIGGKRQVSQVEEDTVLFHEGVLGKTPTGGNITTYKELCSLASDMNKPEMIYQFMQLANHNATWTSKLGAAFGFKSISKEAKFQLQPFLGKIVPRLYRYKYDPTPKIQNSMISIWDSIVSDSKETVELYYWDILSEIVKNLTVPEWRVRIACCLATRDLIKRPNGLRLRSDEKSKETDMESIEVDGAVPEPELRELWTQLFRVMDDVHEGTRLAAEGTVNLLSKVCVIAASSSHGKSTAAVASSILPLILDVGVTHTVPEIRRISIKTISELIESSGPLITPHLPSLIPCLLRATGELETPKLSYLSTRLGAESEAQEAVDSIRAEAAKSNNTMETIAKCVRHIDFKCLEEMTPAVLELMKTSVNLGTKTSCAHFICLISVRLGEEMTSVVGKYLAACFSALKDRNAVVRKYYASALGHLIGIAKENSIKNLFTKLSDFYFEDPSNKGIPLAIQSINKRYHELLKDYAENIMPLIFLAMHEQETEENKSNIELWKDLWSEVSPGDAGIRLNLDAIIPQIEKFLEDASWLRKAQAANAINTIATRLKTDLDEPKRLRLINLLLGCVSGRTFKGKERVLEALASLCKGLNKDDPITTKIIDAAIKECRKEEPVYRTNALKATGDILEELEADRFEEVYNMVWYILDVQDLGSVGGETLSDNVTSEEKNKRANVFNKLKETVCETLGKSWPAKSLETQQKYQLQFVERCSQCLQNNTRQVQVSLLVALGKFLERLQLFDEKLEVNKEKKPKMEQENSTIKEKVCEQVLSTVSFAAGLPHTGLKKECLNIVLVLIRRLAGKENEKHLLTVKKMFENTLVTFQRDSSPEVKCRIKDIEDKLRKV